MLSDSENMRLSFNEKWVLLDKTGFGIITIYMSYVDVTDDERWTHWLNSLNSDCLFFYLWSIASTLSRISSTQKCTCFLFSKKQGPTFVSDTQRGKTQVTAQKSKSNLTMHCQFMTRTTGNVTRRCCRYNGTYNLSHNARETILSLQAIENPHTIQLRTTAFFTANRRTWFISGSTAAIMPTIVSKEHSANKYNYVKSKHRQKGKGREAIMIFATLLYSVMAALDDDKIAPISTDSWRNVKAGTEWYREWGGSH